MKTELEELKYAHPNLEYADGRILKGQDIAVFFAEDLINDHYDGHEITYSHPSGDPQLEYPKSVSGEEYVRHIFGGDYKKAFDNI